MAKAVSQLEEVAAYRNVSGWVIQQKDLDFSKLTNSGDDCHGLDFKNLLSLLFTVEFNSFLGPETYLLSYPAPREF